MHTPQANISEIAAALEAQSQCQPKRGKRYLRVSSPFRPDSDDPTFSFDLETGGAKDWVTGDGYNLEQIAAQLGIDNGWQPRQSLATRRESKPRPRLSDSPEWQAWAAGFIKRSQRHLARNLNRQNWLSARGIEGDHGLGWNPRYIQASVAGQKVSAGAGLVIPHYEDGRIVAVRIRVGAGEYRHVTGGRGDRLYRGDQIAAGATVAMVESELDALCLQTQCPDIVAVATGGTSGGRGAVDRLKAARRVFVAFDADDAGDKAAAWWLSHGSRARPEGAKDICAMYEAGADIPAWLAQASAFDMPDSWRTAMLEHLTGGEAAVTEGIVRIYRKHGEIPPTTAALLFNLGDVGFPLSKRTVQRYVSESGIFHTDFDKFIARLAFQIARRAGRRKYERDSFKARLLACRGILRGLGADGGMDTAAAAKRRRKVRDKLAQGGHSTPLDLLHFDGAIKSPAEYRAAVMRALYTTDGAQSRSKWARSIGCNPRQVKTIAARCKLQLVPELPVVQPVESVSDCFELQRQYPKSKIMAILRRDNRIPFHKAMDIQRGDKVIVQPISRHVELDETPPAPKPTPSSSKKKDIGVHFGAASNMKRPNGSWRGRDYDPAWVYWQHLFALERFGWKIDESAGLIRNKDGFELQNPELLALEILLKHERGNADPLVIEAIMSMGAMIE